MRKDIDYFIQKHFDKVLRDIVDLIQIKSITYNASENKRALNVFLDKAKTMGLKTMITSGEDVGIVELGHGKDTIGILVHLDVAPEGDIDKWSYPPFKGEISKGYIWGRGVEDNKGPAVMCLHALKALKELNIPLEKKIWLIVGTSGDGEWKDIANFKKEFEVPQFGFAPDGDFPIFTKEKGYCDIKLFFHEPEIEKIEILRGGTSLNSIPSKATVKIHNHEEKVYKGISCHSSTPALGINAITKMAGECDEIKDFNFVRFIKDFFMDGRNGEKLGIDFSHNRRNALSERTSLAPTVLSINGGYVEMCINLRLWFDITKDRVTEAFQKYAHEYNYSFRILEYLDPMVVDEKEGFVQTMADVYREYGFTPAFPISMATSCAKTMRHFVGWGPVMEHEKSFSHKEDERMSIESMITATQMYTTYLARVASPYGIGLKNKKQSSLEKALSLLKFFVTDPYHYDVPTLAGLTGMNKTTIYRNLCSLERVGILEKDDDTKLYSIGPMAFRMYQAYLKEKEND